MCKKYTFLSENKKKKNKPNIFYINKKKARKAFFLIPYTVLDNLQFFFFKYLEQHPSLCFSGLWPHTVHGINIGLKTEIGKYKMKTVSVSLKMCRVQIYYTNHKFNLYLTHNLQYE